MTSPPLNVDTPPAEPDVRLLYQEILAAWNRGDASGMAALFADEGGLVGFDGSQIDRRAEIEAHLRQI